MAMDSTTLETWGARHKVHVLGDSVPARSLKSLHVRHNIGLGLSCSLVSVVEACDIDTI